MFSFDVKIVKFENPSETWYQLMFVKYILGIPYYKSYYSTGYGVHEKPRTYSNYESAKKDKHTIYNMFNVKYNTKTIKTILD
jgi:hypothetical protein